MGVLVPLESLHNRIAAAIRGLGGRSGAYFLVDGDGLLLEFSDQPVRLDALSPENQSAVVAQARIAALRVQDLPEELQAEWRAAAPWGEFFYPVFIRGPMRWLAALILTETQRAPSESLDALLQQWVEHAYLRRLLHTGLRQEDERREALSGFLHHDLLQRGLFLKQRLLDHPGDLDDEIELLDDSLRLIQQEVEMQRPVLINQGVFFALQKRAAELRSEGLDITWESGFQASDHPFTWGETAAGIYFIAESLIGEARRVSPTGRIDLRLDPPARSGRSLRLAVSHDGSLNSGYSLGLAEVFERAGMIGAQTEVHQDSGNRIHYRFEV